MLTHDQRRQPFGDTANRPPQRRHELDPDAKRYGDQSRSETDGIRHRDRLWRHFAEQQNQRQHHQNADRPRLFRAIQRHQDTGQIDGRRDIDDFVTTENRDDQASRLIEQGVNRLGIGMPLPTELLQVQFGKREQRGFRTGEERGTKQQRCLEN